MPFSSFEIKLIVIMTIGIIINIVVGLILSSRDKPEHRGFGL